MRKLATLAFGAMLGAAGMTANAYAAAGIEEGSALVTACQSLLDNGSSEGSKGETCKEFVTNMVLAQQDTLTMGEPFRAVRLGANQDEKACFEMPDKLSYRDFAQHVVSYAESNPEVTERPAYELAVRALEKQYPCDPADLKDMEGRDLPAE
jgi:hypothetical protein